MPIVYHQDWDVQRGVKDAERHHKKIDEAIRKNVRNVIGQETIITGKKDKKVRVQVRGLKDYRFIYAKKGQGGGIGQGEGKPGDIIHQKPIGQGQGKGQGGQGEGIHHMEAEVDIDYLLDVMFQDLGLPYLDPKKKNSIEIPKGWKVDSIKKKGVHARLHRKRTMAEAIKRNVAYAYAVMEDTGCSEEDAYRALSQSMGDINEAIEIIKTGNLTVEESHMTIEDDDLRYRNIKEDVEICSKAVVIAMMDVSASMSIDKKYLCKSLLFWMVQFLRKQYEEVEIRFIRHANSAEEVDEQTFFEGDATGGTYAYTAFDKANEMIDNEYPLDEWNIYAVYCSDGEDFVVDKTISSVEDMLKKKINMISYIEIDPYSDEEDSDDGNNLFVGTWMNLIEAFKKHWQFKKVKIEREGRFWINNELHFLLSLIKDKSHIWPTLQHMLSLNHPERKEE